MGQNTRFWYLYAQQPLLKANADVSRNVRGLSFGLSLPLLEYFVNVQNKGSGLSVQMLRVFATCWCNKYPNIVYWPKYSFFFS